jgi:hypothetical protein
MCAGLRGRGTRQSATNGVLPAQSITCFRPGEVGRAVEQEPALCGVAVSLNCETLWKQRISCAPSCRWGPKHQLRQCYPKFLAAKQHQSPAMSKSLGLSQASRSARTPLRPGIQRSTSMRDCRMTMPWCGAPSPGKLNQCLHRTICNQTALTPRQVLFLGRDHCPKVIKPGYASRRHHLQLEGE